MDKKDSKEKPKIFFRIGLRKNEEPPLHELAIILSKEKLDDMISLFTHHAFPEHKPRTEIGILIPGRFETRNEKREYEILDLSPLKLLVS